MNFFQKFFKRINNKFYTKTLLPFFGYKFLKYEEYDNDVITFQIYEWFEPKAKINIEFDIGFDRDKTRKNILVELYNIVKGFENENAIFVEFDKDMSLLSERNDSILKFDIINYNKSAELFESKLDKFQKYRYNFHIEKDTFFVVMITPHVEENNYYILFCRNEMKRYVFLNELIEKLEYKKIEYSDKFLNICYEFAI